VLVAVTAILAAVRVVLDHALPVQPPGSVDAAGAGGPGGPIARRFACVEVVQPAERDSGAGVCPRQALDEGRRLELTPDQRRDAEAFSRRVWRAVAAAAPASAGPGGCSPDCPTRQYPPPTVPGPRAQPRTDAPLTVSPQRAPEVALATAGDPAGLERALRAAGFSDVAARLARPDDPAPPGAVLFAVGDGPVCLVGYQTGTPDGGSERLTGRLPDGRCLPP
jgi:hypothetical protein